MSTGPASLVFTQTPASLAVAVGFVALVLFLGWVAWQRSGWRRATGWLEVLRVLIAVMIAITLNQPEWREVFQPDFKPTLAVLRDVSRSMETRDVVDPANTVAEPKSRAELVAPFVEARVWAGIAERMEVVPETFSSSLEPAVEGSDLNAALAQVSEKHPHLGAVVLLSDGDWTAGEAPSVAATRLRMRGVPVFTLPVGAEARLPDVQLTSFEVPTFAVAGKPVRIPFTIESSLPGDEPALLEMTSSDGEVVSKRVVIPAMSRLQDVLVFKPQKPGELKLSLKVPRTAGERYVENNVLEAPLSVRKEQLRVLVLDTYPRWEFRYLRNALERDPGVLLHCVLLHPDLGKTGVGRGYLPALPKDDDLAGYDVVFLGDVGVGAGQLTPAQCTALQKLVRDQAAGIVFLPGLRGFEGTLPNSPLGDLLPVVLDDANPRGSGSASVSQLVLTDAGTRSLLTKLEDTEEGSANVWRNLPGFQWHAPALRAKAGSEVLATHSTESNRFGRIPLLVTKPYGAGKVLFLGTDGAWRWRKGVEDRYHYRFWGQVVRWMAYQRNMSQGDKMRLFYSPDRPQLGAGLTLNVNATSAAGEPLREGTVVAQLTAPSGKTSSVRLLSAGEDAWGLFSGVFIPAEPGEYRVLVSCAEAGSRLETRLSIQGSSREVVGRPARHDVLREISQLTRGRMLESADPKALLEAVAALPPQELIERRVRIWAHPLWAGLVILLLGIFWAARKSTGSF